jgi:hypothetical protein
MFLTWLVLPGESSAGTPKQPGLTELNLVCVDDQATGYATFQSHNQKVVRNNRGIFMTHLRTRNEKYTAQQWRLSWSRDGGRTFQTLFESTDATNPPVIETDSADNLYVGRQPEKVSGTVSRNSRRQRFLL